MRRTQRRQVTRLASQANAWDRRILPNSGEAFVRSEKKQWVRPEVVPVTLAQARDKLVAALALIESDSELQEECSELRSLINAIDAEIRHAEGASE